MSTALKNAPWTVAEVATLRRLYRTTPVAKLVEMFGRTKEGIKSKAKSLGIARRIKCPLADDVFQEQVRTLNSQGYTNRDIAVELGCCPLKVSRWCKRMKLPSHWKGERFKAKQRVNYAAQCQRNGVASLAVYKPEIYRQFARDNGWPEDLRPRAVQILNALDEHGPMTRRELADAVGLPWKGSRTSLASEDPEGSYLANLMSRGLVVSLGRIAKGDTPMQSCHLYSLSMTAERRCPDGDVA